MSADPLDLEDEEWPMRASELAAVIAWTEGRIDRAAFRRWLRSEGWPEADLDDLTVLLEHIRNSRPPQPLLTPPTPQE